MDESSTPLDFAAHPLRDTLLDEAHSRPFFPCTAPARLIGLAFMLDAGGREALTGRLAEFAARHGLQAAPPDARHHRHDLPFGTLRWEVHTEFLTLVVMLSGRHAEFGRWAGELLAGLPLPETPGRLLASIDLAIIGDAERDAAFARFHRPMIAHSILAEGQAEIASDFAPDPEGFVPYLLVDRGLTGRQIGALARDLTEIEFYRMFALLGLPEAQRIGPVIREVERGLADLTAELVHRQSLADGDSQLARLTVLTARVEAEIARTTFRFGATRAYAAILADRLVGLGRPAGPSAPALAAFLERRNLPAFRTCERMEANLVGLAARLTRTSSLLRTRVDVELARQNNALLAAMGERARLQLRLQQTVEGLSVAAVSYYVIGLVAYLLKAGKEAHLLPLPLDIAVGLAVPAVVLVMWLVVHRIRRRHGGGA